MWFTAYLSKHHWCGVSTLALACQATSKRVSKMRLRMRSEWSEGASCGRFKGKAPMIKAGFLMFQGYERTVMVPAPCELDRCASPTSSYTLHMLLHTACCCYCSALLATAALLCLQLLCSALLASALPCLQLLRMLRALAGGEALRVVGIHSLKICMVIWITGHHTITTQGPQSGSCRRSHLQIANHTPMPNS